MQLLSRYCSSTYLSIFGVMFGFVKENIVFYILWILVCMHDDLYHTTPKNILNIFMHLAYFYIKNLYVTGIK